MSVHVNAFLTSSYQRVFLDALRSDLYRWSPSFDGTALGRWPPGLSADPGFRLLGTDLTLTESGDVEGRVTGFEVYPEGAAEPAFTVDAAFDLARVITLARSIEAPAVELGASVAGWTRFLDAVTPDDTRMIGNGGTNVLEGDATTRILRGNGGDDVLAIGATTIPANGGRGKDTLTFEGAAGPILLDGEEVIFAQGRTGAAVAYRSVEQFVGSPFYDTLDGGPGGVTIFGLGGADAISGHFGADELHGEDGRDTIHGYERGDLLFGDAHADSLRGGDGRDTLFGGTGNDSLYGDRGADSLMGEFGLDFIEGRKGNDTLVGGADADVFSFRFGISFFEGKPDVVRADGKDRIEDFEIGTDIVRIDAPSGVADDDVRLRLLQTPDGTVLFYGLKGADGRGRIKFAGDFFDETLLDSPAFLDVV